MKLGVVLRCLCIASGVLVGAAAAVARSRRQRPVIPFPRSPRLHAEFPEAASRRDYFAITKIRGTGEQQKWVLQGFGRFECFLLFDSWREAMDQACFRTETLATPELVQVQPVR